MKIIKQKFAQIDINDNFFNSLKKTYPDFELWFKKKSNNGSEAFVVYDDKNKIIGFLALKIEDEMNHIWKQFLFLVKINVKD